MAASPSKAGFDPRWLPWAAALGLVIVFVAIGVSLGHAALYAAVLIGLPLIVYRVAVRLGLDRDRVPPDREW